MTSYVIRRLLIGVIIIILVTVLVFLVMRLLPGDPLYLFLAENQIENFSEQQLQEIRHQYGLDKTLPMQYIDWISNTIRGNLGYSVYNQTSINTLLASRFPVTAELSIISLIFGHAIGLLVGIVAALRRGKLIDSFATAFTYIGVTIPSFWLAILLIYLMGLKLGWLPLSGWTSPSVDLGMHVKQLIMPVFCLSIAGIASTARLMRSSMLEVIQQDYVRTAWSKGLGEQVIVLRHALKNSFIPIITVLGMGMAHIFGGSFIIETLFSIPGMGRLMVTSLYAHDYNVVQFSALFTAFLIVMSNVIVDISYGFFDPRIRYN
jgi:peptide/nickel transport system permease protein